MLLQEQSDLVSCCLQYKLPKYISSREREIEQRTIIVNRGNFYTFLTADDEGTEKIAEMCRLICTYVVYLCQNQIFHQNGPYPASTQP